MTHDLPATFRVKQLHADARLPSKARLTDAGFDLYSPVDFTLYPFSVGKVPTGIALELPHGHVGIIKDRSSMGAKGIHTLGGIVDESYRGEIFVCLVSLGAVHEIKEGDRIAQLLLHEVPLYEAIWADELSDTDRGSSGFGSSGR